MKLNLFLIATLSLFIGHIAAAQSSYHCNGNYKQSGSSYYHANGNYLKSGSSLYHMNGNYLKSGSSLYHANGNYFKSGSSYYHANGNYLISGSSIYHANGNYLKSGSSCYYENGNSMGTCPKTYSLTNANGDKASGAITIELDLTNTTVKSYSVQVSGTGFTETYTIDMEGEILELDSSCSSNDNGSVDGNTLTTISQLFNQTNAATKKAVKDQICH